jgi:hypothetical protein
LFPISVAVSLASYPLSTIGSLIFAGVFFLFILVVPVSSRGSDDFLSLFCRIHFGWSVFALFEELLASSENRRVPRRSRRSNPLSQAGLVR